MASIRNLAVVLVTALFVNHATASSLETLSSLTSSYYPQTATPTCTTTIFEGGKLGALSSATCTFYSSYSTSTCYVDCEGCELKTLRMGPGPVVRCGTHVTDPLGTETVTACQVATVTATATETATEDGN